MLNINDTKSSRTKYIVRQTFESVGDPAESSHATLAEAEEAADSLAEVIASALFKRNGDWAVVEHSSRYTTGYTSEIEFWATLSNDANAEEDRPGSLPWADIVAAIRSDIIMIELVTGKVTGEHAIRLAERDDLTLYCHSNPVEGARTVDVDTARQIAKEDPSLVYVIVSPLGWVDKNGKSTADADCYNVNDYFDANGKYLGPDEYGVEPKWNDALASASP